MYYELIKTSKSRLSIFRIHNYFSHTLCANDSIYLRTTTTIAARYYNALEHFSLTPTCASIRMLRRIQNEHSSTVYTGYCGVLDKSDNANDE